MYKEELSEMTQSERAGDFDMLAKTMHGLEDILQKELTSLGAQEIQVGRRMVSFRGDLRLLYKANIHLRTAIRILVPIAQFKAQNADEVYQYLYDHIKWDQYIGLRNTYAFDTVVYSDKFTHSKFVAYRAKDALHDYFQDKKVERIPNVSVVSPDLQFHIHIADDLVTLALDSSGESLHRRGYRIGQNDAPISEVLAAGILMKASWEGQCDFLDPMCGSGTFLTEAALIALGIPPGIFRKEYAFEKWADFDPDLLSELLEEWEEKPFEHKIYGSDIHPKAIAISRGNIKNTGIQKYVELSVKRFEDYTEENRPAETGLIVTNPPYGDRMRPGDLERLYSDMGSTLKHAFMGWQAWIISGSLEVGFNALGLKHNTRETLYNGSIECELRSYELFSGKRNDHLQELEELGLLDEIREERERYIAEREKYAQARQAYRMGRQQNELLRIGRRERVRTDNGSGRYDRGYRDHSRKSFRDQEHRGVPGEVQRDFKKHDRRDREERHYKPNSPTKTYNDRPNLAYSTSSERGAERGIDRRRERAEYDEKPRGTDLYPSKPKTFQPRDNSERQPEKD